MNAPTNASSRTRFHGLFARLRSALCVAALGAAALGVGGCANTEKSSVPAFHTTGPEPDVRIRIGSTHDRVEFGSPATVEVDAGAFSRGWVRVQTPVTVRLSDDVWVISERGGNTRRFGSVRPLKVRAADGMSVAVDGGTYAGEIELIARPAMSAGAFDVIAHVPMEKYLPGVLAKELYQDWTRGAYEAQAIAARSYAVHERTRRISMGQDYDLETTTADQVYGGDTTNRTALAAVEATRGLVLTYQGFPLRAYYSSSCGGRPNSAREIWPTGPGYEFNLAAPLDGKPRPHFCQISPLYRWTVTRDTSDLVRRISAYGTQQGLSIKAIGSLSRIEATKRTSLGRPTEYRVTDTAGKSWLINAEMLRFAMNFGDGSSIPAITRPQRVNSGDFDAVVRGPSTSINGRGFGHGVGMCQFCVEGLGRKGDRGRDIVVRFYPGATLQKMW